MGASKKQRGKQRKAAKSKAAESGNNIHQSQISPTQLVALIQRGDNTATEFYISGDYSLSQIQTDKVLSTAINYLQRCENETFDNVMAGLGGDLVCPAQWVHLLFRTSASIHILQIAKNIGPLLNCMCDDKKMLFFQSKKHWAESLRSFAQLICRLMHEGISIESEDPLKREAVTVLIGHEGLVRSIVQWASFWFVGSCPDLFDEIGMDDYTLIQSCGKVSTELLLKDRSSLVETIGAMQVTLPENGIASFTAGLIRRMKMEFEKEYLSILHHLIVDGDCVDKSVITEMIGFGVNSVEYEEATPLVTNYIFSMLYQGTVVSEQYLSDTRVVFAIREGLIQMSLTFMERFGRRSINQNDSTETVFRHIEGIFKTVHDLALHKNNLEGNKTQEARY